MNKSEQATFYKRQIKTAQEIITVSKAQIEIATQMESEAARALEALGVPKERTRKGALSDMQVLKLRASFIKTKKPAARTTGSE